MMYSGYYAGTADNQVQNYCAAYAATIDGPYIKDANNPVLLANTYSFGKWAMNGGQVWVPALNLWVAVLNYSSGMALCTSPDLSNWTVVGALFNSISGADPFLRTLSDGSLELWYAYGSSLATRAMYRAKCSNPALANTLSAWVQDAANPIVVPSPSAGGEGQRCGNGLGEPCAINPVGDTTQAQILVAHDGIPVGQSTNYRSIQFAASIDNGATWRYCGSGHIPSGSGYMSAQVFDSYMRDVGDGTLRLFHSSSNVAGLQLDINIQIGEATAPSIATLAGAYTPIGAQAPANAKVVVTPGNGVNYLALSASSRGSALTQFHIFKGSAAGAESATPYQTITLSNNATTATFQDTQANSSPATYYITATNALGTATSAEASGTPSASAIVTPEQLFGASLERDWDVASLSGLTNNALVSSWPDSSSNADPAIQSTAANQPTYTTAGVDGKPGVLFGGAAELNTQLSAAPTARTVFFVGSINTLAANNPVISSYPYGGFELNLSSGKPQINAAYKAAVGTMTTALAAATLEMVQASFDGANWAMSINGGAAQTGTSTTTFNTSKSIIGQDVTSAGKANGYLNGEVKRIVSVNRLVTAQEAQTMQAYMQSLYGSSV